MLMDFINSRIQGKRTVETQEKITKSQKKAKGRNKEKTFLFAYYSFKQPKGPFFFFDYSNHFNIYLSLIGCILIIYISHVLISI